MVFPHITNIGIGIFVVLSTILKLPRSDIGDYAPTRKLQFEMFQYYLDVYYLKYHRLYSVLVQNDKKYVP